ncbi:Fur family ferric uptake transcriptional regulator [Pontibacter mucosus]|uniref:Fur family ferric uptake transcriptional regulator n=1 Tax=Pontibacter mucosus TaxID=1649266 RepID=A0A2T5Y9U1_9BACT|nr:transcriptional repressor [Pontibacter mucosus]PTX13167.1 Fur family ferric uptake transcriptional regulator [Pontibacter mucosus]
MLQKLDNILLEKEIKPTAMRLLVLDFLLSQQTAVSLSDLEAAFYRSDRITLYRTLKTFEEKGLVHSIMDGTGSVKYAICEEGCECAPEDMHVHFFCNKCQETICLPKSRIPKIPLPDNFKQEEINLVIKGTCGNCS